LTSDRKRVRKEWRSTYGKGKHPREVSHLGTQEKIQGRDQIETLRDFRRGKQKKGNKLH